jgi:hypothetical protein
MNDATVTRVGLLHQKEIFYKDMHFLYTLHVQASRSYIHPKNQQMHTYKDVQLYII